MLKNLRKNLLNVLLFCSPLLVIGCSPTTIPVKVELPLPPELVVPPLPPEGLECVSDETWLLIKERSDLRRARIKMLREIIQSTR